MSSHTYRTSDGVGVYRFGFEWVRGDPGGFRCLILSQPGYGARPANPAATYRRALAGRPHCVAIDPLPTVEAARAASGRWAEANQHYLATGRFDFSASARTAPLAPRRAGESDYITLDKTAIYRFRIQQHGRVWRAHIVAQPHYAGRPEGAVQSHRLNLNSDPYVCWEPEPASYDAAQEVARLWAEATHLYIARGRFPSPDEIPSTPTVGSPMRASGRYPDLRRRFLRRIG